MSDKGENKPQKPVTPLEYARPTATWSTWPGYVVGIIIASIIGCILLVLILLPEMGRAREPANRVKCSSNMKQIGLAIASYANDHGGRFPDDLDTILETEDVTPAVVICPSGNDVPTGVPTSQPVGTKFLTSGHVSYIYLGKGLNTQTVAPDVVLLYEPLGNHSNVGMNVLFGDFHAEWLTVAQVQPILKQVAGGVFPIRLPATTTQPFPNP